MYSLGRTCRKACHARSNSAARAGLAPAAGAPTSTAVNGLLLRFRGGTLIIPPPPLPLAPLLENVSDIRRAGSVSDRSPAGSVSDRRSPGRRRGVVGTRERPY